MRKIKLFLTLLMLMCIGVTQMWGAEVTISPSQALNDGGVDPITIACAKGDGSSDPAISSGQLRLYQAGSGKTTGNTITFSSDKTITSIVFTFANSMTASNGSFSEGSYDSESSTWTGSTTSLTLTVTGTTSGTRIYITEMVVTYDGGSTPPADPFTVSFSTGTGNGTVNALTENPAGAGITLPAGPASIACEGWSFAGWAEAAVASETTTAPTLLAVGANYKPTDDVTLYAVYSRTESGSGGGVEDKSKTEGFETKATSTTYNGTVTINTNESDCGIGWNIYYGTVSTNDKITGSNSAQMRWYSSATSNIPYANTTTAISGLQSVDFKARVSDTKVKMSLWYSTDGENWTVSNVNQETFAAASTAYDFSATINGEVGTGYYVKIGEDGGTAPSSSNVKLIIDAVTFNYQEGSGSSSTTYYLSAPTCSTPTCEKLGTPVVSVPDATLTYNSAKLTWGAIPNAAKYVVKFNGEDHETTNLYYEATGLNADTEYSYQVKAIAAANQDAYCDGDFSASANFTTLAAPALAVDPTSWNFETVATDAEASKVFSVSGTNLEAGTLSISVPNGYSVNPASINVAAAGSLEATNVTVSKNTTTAAEYNGNMTISGCGLASAVEVALSMTVAEKYTVNFNTGAGNPTQADITETAPNAGITLPAGPTPKCVADGWAFAGWAKAAVDAETTSAPALLSGTYHPEANNETLYAVYSRSEASENPNVYAKVTDAAILDNGDNFILVSTGSYTASQVQYNFTKAMKGKNGTNTNFADTDVTIYSDEVVLDANSEAVVYTLKKVDSKWKIYAGENYLKSGNKSLDNTTEDEATEFSISISEGNATISDGTYNLQYNPNSGNGRFACYNSAQKPVMIFKNSASTIYYLSAPACCDKHAITIATGIEHGSVSADLEEACAGVTITLTFTPAANYHLSGWTLNGTAQDKNANTFLMPAGNATISATFEEDACTPLDQPVVAVSGKAYPYDAVKLAWTAIDNANLYKVYIYDAEDNELEKDEAFEGVEYTIDLDLEASTTYKYSVQAVSNTPAVHCPSEAATGTFATDALPTAHLTLIDAAGGHASSDDYTILTAFNLPNAAAVPQGCPKVFVGWDADENCATEPTYAAGAEFTFANTTGVTLYAVYAKANAGTAVTYPIDFEDNSDTFTDWTLTNITSKQTDGNVDAHEGSYFAVTAGTTSASLVTKEKIASPSSITFYVSKKTTNTSASSWVVEVSADGSAWTQVGEEQDAKSMTRGTWVEVTRNLSEYSDVYVRVYYEGGTSTAVRCIDDLELSAIGSTTYSEYGTACEACKVVTLAKSGEDQEKGNTFALKVGEEVVESIQTCEAAIVKVDTTIAVGYQVSFAVDGIEGASINEDGISIPANANGTLTVTATYSQINYSVTMAQVGGANATLSEDQSNKHYGDQISISTTIPDGYQFNGWTPADLFASAEAAAAASTSFTMPNNDVTVTANFAKKYTVTFNVGSNPITEESVGAGVELPAGPAPSEACVAAGWAFAGWAEAAVASETTDAQTLFNGEYHPASDIMLYAVYSRTESGDEPADTSYVKTAFADLVSGDAIVITNDAYALSTVTASKGQPVATAVTVAENVITSSSVEGLVWDITKGEENFSLTVHGGTNKLYSTDTNNGLRIGTEDNYLFNITDNYLFNIGTSRYVGVYNSEDWRNYTEINANISDQELAFYKAVSTSSSTTYYWSAPECCVPHNVTIADGIQNGSVVANPTSACADATITVTLTPAEGYELASWTVDGTAQELTATTFTMPNKAVEVSATFSEIVTPPAEATLKLMENGNEVVFAGNHNVGEVVTLPNALSDDEHACEGKVLKGWSTEEITTPVADKPEENFYELGDSYTIASEADVLYAVFAEAGAGAETITQDVLTRATTGSTGTSYAAWSGKTATTEAVYAGNSAGGNESIQLRSNNNNSGVVTTASGGNARKVTVTWHSETASGRTIDIYGKSTAYTAASDLYAAATQGTKLGSIVYGTSTELTIDADYEYIGIRSASGALYLSDVTIDWGSPGDVVYSNYATSCVAPLANPIFSVEGGEYTEAQTITLSAEEGTIHYTLNGATPTSASPEYTEAIVLNDCGTTTIKAIAISANNHSEVVSETYTLNIPLPEIIDSNPYTPAQAIAVYDGHCYNNEMVYVKGVVKTSSGLNTQYGNYDNIVVVAAETDAPEFTFFHMYKGAEKVQFDANDPAIAAGDTIVAYGELTKFNQIYEFKDGCYLISRQAYDAPKQPIVNDLESAYTLAQAIEFLENAATYDLSGEVYVKGVATTDPNDFGTFNAHDPEAENVFQFYNTDLNELAVGVNDTIIVKGLIKKVNANYRMDAGVVQEVKAYVAPVVPEFTVNPTAVAFGNVEQNAQVGDIELNVELTAIANATVTLADENNVFSIDKTALTETGVVTVSVVSTATVGNYAATITLHDVAEAAEDVVVNVTMNVTEVETRNIANGSAFTAISGDLDPAHIKYAAFKGDGTTTPAITKDSDIRLYKPDANNDKTTGGYLKLTALMGCTIDQVEITFNGNATASYAVNDAEFSTEAYITGATTLLTPAELNAQSVSIVNLKNGSIDIHAIKVYYNGSPLAVDHYILGGEYATEFEQYGTFSYEGLTVTAAYDAEETITEPVSGFTVEADLMTAGAKKAEVYLGETKITEYDITVTESQKKNPNLAYTPSEQTIAAAEVASWEAPVFSNEFNVTPAYNSSKPAVAAVDENGVITLAGGYGTAVITASFAGNDDYIASQATYTITVSEPVDDIKGHWVATNAVQAGMEIIIANVADANGNVKTMGSQNNNNRAAVESKVNEKGVLSPASGTKIFTLVDAGNGNYNIKAVNNNYLYAASGSSNHLKEEATPDANHNADWAISFANGKATIIAQGNNARNWMRYNSGNDIFSCYASDQEDIVIYAISEEVKDGEVIDASSLREDEDIVINGNASMTINDEVSLGDIYVKDGQTLTIQASEDATIGNLDLENGAVWDLGITNPNATVTVNNLILRSNSASAANQTTDAQPGKSSQAPGVLPVINGVLALEIDLRPDLGANEILDTEASSLWYCISAPFDVDVNSGFEWVYPDGHREAMIHNTDFQIFAYDGARRASGISGWQRIGGTMKAGVAHFIGFDNEKTNQKVIRLTAKTNTISTANTIPLSLYAGSDDNKNWNGVANPTLQYIGIDKDIVAFDYLAQDYNTYAYGDYNYAVGSPFFIQAVNTDPIVIDDETHGAVRAPQRTEGRLEYCVRIQKSTSKGFEGQMYVRASETASNQYEAGHDMASMGSTTPKYSARIWTENYNVRLGIEEAPLTNGNATYVLGIATPSAGEYTISVAAPKENADLYLTYNGSIIWNLSDGAYTVDLAKGVTSGYGLVLQAKAPHVATGVDNAEANEAGVQKVIINNHVYILRAEQMYDVTGKLVK